MTPLIPLSPRSQYARVIGTLLAEVEDAKKTGISAIHDSVYRNRFLPILDRFYTQLQGIAALLQGRGTYVLPAFEVRSQEAQEEITKTLAYIEHWGLQSGDKQIAQIIFGSFQKQLASLTVGFKPPVNVHSNPVRAPDQQVVIRALLEFTLSKISCTTDIHPNCFISYARDSQESEALIQKISKDLQSAGSSISLDKWDIKPGDNKLDHSGRVKLCHYILLMGSPELYHHFEKKDDHLLVTELGLVSIKSSCEPKSVIPCLLSGDHARAFPFTIGGGENLKFSDFRQDKGYEEGLLEVLLRIFENSKSFEQIRDLCLEFLEQKKFIDEGQYSTEKLSEKLKEWQEQKKQLHEQQSQRIDRTLNGHQVVGVKTDLILLNTPLDDFVGRHQQLNYLKQVLLSPRDEKVNSCHVAVLAGTGGVGKSELACYFANHFQQQFSLICWIDCETSEMLLQGYKELAKRLNLFIDDKEPYDRVIKTVHRCLESRSFGRPWLLIFDNVVEQLELPKRGGCVLGTSIRRDLWPNPEKCLEVPVFEEAEAVEYVKERSKQENIADIKLLVNELGGFPLAVAQAVALIVEAGIPIADYLIEFKKNQLEYLQQEGTARHQRSLVTTWSLTLDYLKRHHQLAFDWLNICAHLGSGRIPQSWALTWLRESNPTASPLMSFQLLRTLQNFSLVRSDFQTKSFTLHKLMKTVISQMQSEEAKNFYKQGIRVLKKEGEQFNLDIAETMREVDIWISHANEVMSQEGLLQEDELTQEWLWGKLGAFNRWKGDEHQSLEAFSKVLQVFEKAHGITNRSPKYVHNNMGIILAELGRNDEALWHLHQALDKKQLLEGKVDHLSVATALSNLAMVLVDPGKKQESLKLLIHALILERKIIPSGEDKRFATVFSNLGFVLSSIGFKKEALKNFEKAFQLLQKYYGTSPHPTLAIVLNNIGSSVLNLGYSEMALKMYREALQMQREIYGLVNHPDIATSLNNMGYAYYLTKDYKEASNCLFEALEMWTNIYGTIPNFKTAFALFNIWNVFAAQENYPEALKYAKETLVMRRQIYGSAAHPAVASTLNNLGKLFLFMGRLEDALEHSREALKIYIEFHGDIDHQDIEVQYGNIGFVLSKMGHIDEAQINKKQARQMHHRLKKKHRGKKVNHESLTQVELSRYSSSHLLDKAYSEKKIEYNTDS